MVYKAVTFGKPLAMRSQISLFPNVKLFRAIRATPAMAGLSAGALLAVALLSSGSAHAQNIAKPGSEAAPQAVPGFWDPRRRPDRPDLSRLEWVTEAPQMDAGFIDELEHWRISVPRPRFVIIDVLQRIKPAGSMTRNAYENDYAVWSPLQDWATRHGIAVLGLHHTKKGGADDPLETLSGSNGLSACADTTLVLDSDQNGKTLYVRGRDVKEKETALIFAGGFWTILGEAADVRRSDERTGIIATLKENDAPMTPAEMATATGKPSLNVRQLLFKMAKAGEVHRVGGSRYWLEPLDLHNSDNSDNGEEDE